VREAPRPRRSVRGTQLAAALAAVALVVVLWGGYARDWRWTGFEHNATLWDWLHLLALPIALAVAPLWLRHRTELGRRRTALLGVAGAAFVVLVVVGYALDLGWTGFPGNELWDWLELLVLPLAIALAPVWLEISRGIRPHHLLAAACLLAALVVAIVGGYAYGWHWTGFKGNTLFDWLQLFIAPLLLPLALVPLASEWMVADADSE
jgi:hypothetical protein